MAALPPSEPRGPAGSIPPSPDHLSIDRRRLAAEAEDLIRQFRAAARRADAAVDRGRAAIERLNAYVARSGVRASGPAPGKAAAQASAGG